MESRDDAAFTRAGGGERGYAATERGNPVRRVDETKGWKLTLSIEKSMMGRLLPCPTMRDRGMQSKRGKSKGVWVQQGERQSANDVVKRQGVMRDKREAVLRMEKGPKPSD